MAKIKHPKTYSKSQIWKIGEAGKIVAEVLNVMKDSCVEGITTQELDILAADHIKKLGAKSALYGFQRYPAHTCISIDEIILHGIPNDTVIKKGMLVNLDCSVNYKGAFADAAINVEVGKVDKEKKRLNTTTYECLMGVIDIIKPGLTIREISQFVEKFAHDNNYDVVRDFQGHGIGRQLHEPPQIPHFDRFENPYKNFKLKTGNVLAIEPCLVENSELSILPDGWSIVNKDKSLGAAWEHTIVVTENGCKILTQIEE